MSIKTMADLLKKQEAERQDLAAGVYNAWQSVHEKERQLLSSFNNTYENAPADIQKEIVKARENYFTEWGSDGKLAALMEARHSKERERLAERQIIFKQLQQQQNRKNDHDNGR